MNRRDVRLAHRSDVPQIIELLSRMDEEDGCTRLAQISADSLTKSLFESTSSFGAFVAAEDSRLVGLAAFHIASETFGANPGIRLDDLYVIPERRRMGIARTLMQAVARHARDRGLDRIAFNVVTSNEQALAFYKSVRVKFVDGFHLCRLDQSVIEALILD